MKQLRLKVLLISLMTITLLACQHERTVSTESPSGNSDEQRKYAMDRDSLILAKESQLNKTVTDIPDYPYYLKYKLVKPDGFWTDARTGLKIEVKEILAPVQEEFLKARFIGEIQCPDTTITANRENPLRLESYEFQYDGDYYRVVVSEINVELGYVLAMLSQLPAPVNLKK